MTNAAGKVTSYLTDKNRTCAIVNPDSLPKLHNPG